jgi:hypothetical protein
MAPLLSKLYLQHSKSSVRTKNALFSLLGFFQIFSKIFLNLTISGDDVRTIPSTSSSLAPAYRTPAKDIAAFPLYYTSWIKLGFFRQASTLESRFFVEAKVFSFLVEEGKPKLFVEQKRRGFLGCLFGSHGGGLVARNVGRAAEVFWFRGFLQIHPGGMEGSHCQEGW